MQAWGNFCIIDIADSASLVFTQYYVQPRPLFPLWYSLISKKCDVNLPKLESCGQLPIV